MRLLVILASLLSVFSHSIGIDTCMNAPNHGSWGTGTPFNLQLLSGNQTVTSYIPHTNYSLVLSGNSAFRGFITTAGNKTGLFTDVSSQPLGNLHMDPTDRNVREMTSCPGLTQVSNSGKRQVKAIWTAPANGNVTFTSIIVVTQNGNNYRASLVVQQSNQSHSATPSALPSMMNSLSQTGSTTTSKTSTMTVSASERKSSSETRSATMSISVSGSIGLSSTSSHTITESSTLTPAFSETMTASSSITLSATNSPPITPTETPDGTPTQTPVRSMNVSEPQTYAREVPQQPIDHSAEIGISTILGVIGIVLAGVGIGYYTKNNNRKSLSSRQVIDFVIPSQVTANPLKTEMKDVDLRTIV
jgi:hypothetical protein